MEEYTEWKIHCLVFILINISVYILSPEGICKKCRSLIKAVESKESPESHVQVIGEKMQELTLVKYILAILTVIINLVSPVKAEKLFQGSGLCTIILNNYWMTFL